MANPLRFAARALTGTTYAYLGYQAWRTPGGRVDAAGSTLAAIRQVAPLPEDDELLVRANGAVQAVAGSALTLGVLPRLSGLALIGSLVPTTVAGHAFWEAPDAAARTQQTTQFLKNMAMIGGLVYVVLDGKR